MPLPPGLYFSHPSSLQHDPRERMPGHPDIPERLVAIESLLGTEDWLGWERRASPAVSERELQLIHEPEHVAQIKALAQAGGGAIDLDTAVGAHSYEAAVHAAGGASALVGALLSNEAPRGVSVARPPGHHAEADRAMGFCLFDNVAVAAEFAIRELGIERVFVLDWDVHHGNGTAEIFRDRDDVLFASIHQAGLYPGSGPLDDAGTGAGAGYTLNLPVPAGSEGELWLSLLEHVALPIAREFAPELILISAGFDAHRADPLAGCRLETADFAAMARQVRDLATALDAPLGAVLEGGYAPEVLAECTLATLAALAGEDP
ncbi:MAG TPA: histone deacetylase, partial [Solirubrobacteraceae bacterium]